jgi:hypothetical protein
MRLAAEETGRAELQNEQQLQLVLESELERMRLATVEKMMMMTTTTITTTTYDNLKDKDSDVPQRMFLLSICHASLTLLPHQTQITERRRLVTEIDAYLGTPVLLPADDSQ